LSIVDLETLDLSKILALELTPGTTAY